MTLLFALVSDKKCFTMHRVNTSVNTGRRAAQRLRLSVAITRQGAMAGARRRVGGGVAGPAERARGVLYQLVLIAIGSTLIGVGVGLFLRAGLGLPPYDVLLSALSEPLGISHGQTAWALAVVLFAVAALFGQRPTIYGLVFTVTNGLAVDWAHALIETPEGMGSRVFFVAAGMAAIAGGIAVATSTSTTGGPFDLLMMAGNKHGFDPYKVRTALEVGVLIGGVAGGGDFGLATVLFAVVIGSVIRIWATALNDHREGRAFRRARAEIAADQANADSASTDATGSTELAEGSNQADEAIEGEVEEDDAVADAVVQSLIY